MPHLSHPQQLLYLFLPLSDIKSNRNIIIDSMMNLSPLITYSFIDQSVYIYIYICDIRTQKLISFFFFTFTSSVTRLIKYNSYMYMCVCYMDTTDTLSNDNHKHKRFRYFHDRNEVCRIRTVITTIHSSPILIQGKCQASAI